MIRRNLIANYVGRVYVTVVGIFALPLYMQYLGSEAYGLVGLFTVVQLWVQLLNMGLAPTLGREAAKARVVQDGFQTFHKILVSYELIFLCISCLLALGAIFGSVWFAGSWLNLETLSISVVQLSVFLMLLAAALRFQSSLYRSGIMGLEHQGFVNVVDIAFATFRFLGGLALVVALSNDVSHYFIYQLVLSAVELVVVRGKQVNLVPEDCKQPYRFYWEDVKPTMPFAFGVAYTAGLWVLITQIDKAILSGVLTLTEFGYYSLVALVAGGILKITQPISEAIRPRLTAFAVSENTDDLHRLYLLGTQLVTAVALSASFIVAFNSQLIFYVWTGSSIAAEWSEEVMFWVALGNGVLAVGAFQYYLQFAYGKLKLHVLGTSLSAVVQVPIIAYAAFEYGALGAGKAWFGVRLIFFLFWVPVVHRTFAKGIHLEWLFRCVFPQAITGLVLTMFLASFGADFDGNRIYAFQFLLGQSIVVLLVMLVLIFKVRSFFGKLMIIIFKRINFRI